MTLVLEGVIREVGAETHIHPLDLALEPGTLTVLLGRTQAGKTTLMRLMAGLERPSRGRVLADGRDVTGVSVRNRDVAMVYQQFINYPSKTVYDNIASPLRLKGLGRAEIDRRVRETASMLRIDRFLERLPGELSGGQQQRTAIARALANDPKILLLDEPFGALDTQTRALMQELLLSIWEAERKTVLFVTHDIDEAVFLANRVIVMSARPGRIIEDRPIALPHPRHYTVKTTPEFQEHRAALTEAVRQQAMIAAGMAA